MGHQGTRDDRSLLNGRSTGTRGATGRGSSRNGHSAGAGSSSTEGVWDAESFGTTEDEAAASDPETVARVDRDKLTDRQLEVLQTAYDMGYYEYPRGANASEVAEALDICPSTLAEHLAAAQTKLLEDVLADRED